jgi:hypothetical protein
MRGVRVDAGNVSAASLVEAACELQALLDHRASCGLGPLFPTQPAFDVAPEPQLQRTASPLPDAGVGSRGCALAPCVTPAGAGPSECPGSNLLLQSEC